MNDLLKNLRNSSKKGHSIPKKDFDSHYYSQDDPRETREKGSNDLLLEAKIRHYNAASTFFENLNRLLIGDLIAAEKKGFKIIADDTLGTRYTKDEILSLIRTMRKKKATFSAIADYLKEKGIPTFSGRGEWHAQTVHRLCK